MGGGPRNREDRRPEGDNLETLEDRVASGEVSRKCTDRKECDDCNEQAYYNQSAVPSGSGNR